MQSTFHNARISPKKANLVAGIVRGMKAVDAIARLDLTPKKAAGILSKVIGDALANAKNNFDQKEEHLVITSILVNKGMVLKRGIPIARGQWHPLLKRSSHITVELGVQTPEKKSMEKKSPEKSEAPKEEEPATKPTTKRTSAKRKKTK